MAGQAVSWIMAARKYGLVTADEMFPDDDQPRRRPSARKQTQTVAPTASLPEKRA